MTTPAEGVPEGPGAVCGVCQRHDCATLGAGNPAHKREHHENWARHWRLGYERMRAERDSFLAKKRDATAAATEISAERNQLRARLVEVERELAAARAYGATMDLGHDMAAARALQAEGAARTLREIVDVWKYIHGVAKGRRMWVLGWEIWLGIIANANAVLSGLPPLTSETATAAPGLPLTPAALVPKEAAAPEDAARVCDGLAANAGDGNRIGAKAAYEHAAACIRALSGKP